MKQIKIILFMGGFAGDLMTALHDMRCFRELTPEGKIEIDKDLLLLQNVNHNMQLEQKEKYLHSNQIISCCDTEFALKYNTNTLMITCEEISMSKYFCKRFFKYHPNMLKQTSCETYHKSFLEWSAFWKKKFKNRLDISDIFTNNDFLSKLAITLTNDKIKLFDEWKNINQRIFLDQKENFDQ